MRRCQIQSAARLNLAIRQVKVRFFLLVEANPQTFLVYDIAIEQGNRRSITNRLLCSENLLKPWSEPFTKKNYKEKIQVYMYRPKIVYCIAGNLHVGDILNLASSV